jgi:hypothetical protein
MLTSLRGMLLRRSDNANASNIGEQLAVATDCNILRVVLRIVILTARYDREAGRTSHQKENASGKSRGD